ncbi:MAG: AMP-binding protein [Firmicutes bacterium]|nr:AMP-binding protein [Bacillota bacterium]
MDLIRIIEENVSRHPEKRFLFREKELDYQRLWENAEKVRRSLKGLGISKGDRIAIQMGKRMEFIYTYLANLMLGSILVPLNNAYTRDEMAYFLADSESRVLVTEASIAARLGLTREEFPFLEHLVVVEDRGQDLESIEAPGIYIIRFGSLLMEGGSGIDFDLDPKSVTLIIYTSGTTGRSKGAMLTRDNILNNLESLREAWGHTSRDVLLHTLPLFHVHGLLVALTGALHSGMEVVMRSRFEPFDVLGNIEKHRCSVFMGVPTMYQRLLQMDDPRRFDLSSMRLWVSGSAPLTAAAFERFRRAFGHTILERYGMSETGMNVSNPLQGERKPGSVGRPLPGVSARVVGDDGADLGAGPVGEIWVKGRNVFAGYWRMPEKTGESFVDGWFRTGDLGYWDRDGYLFLVSRAKDLVISGGLNVYPKEIEALIETLDGVEEAAVIGLPDEDLGERVTAVVALRSGARTGRADIERLCRDNLAGYKRPKEVHLVDALPKNTMGKVMKNVLRERYREKTPDQGQDRQE